MRFSEAIEQAMQGKAIRRSGWNGKNQFVYYQEGSTISYARLRCDTLKRQLLKLAGPPTPSDTKDVTIMGHFDIFTEQKVVQCGWLARQSDLQADDWEVFDD
jgi:hypothetical protein